jgi:hypothetical protein
VHIFRFLIFAAVCSVALIIAGFTGGLLLTFLPGIVIFLLAFPAFFIWAYVLGLTWEKWYTKNPHVNAYVKARKEKQPDMDNDALVQWHEERHDSLIENWQKGIESSPKKTYVHFGAILLIGFIMSILLADSSEYLFRAMFGGTLVLDPVHAESVEKTGFFYTGARLSLDAAGLSGNIVKVNSSDGKIHRGYAFYVTMPIKDNDGFTHAWLPAHRYISISERDFEQKRDEIWISLVKDLREAAAGIRLEEEQPFVSLRYSGIRAQHYIDLEHLAFIKEYADIGDQDHWLHYYGSAARQGWRYQSEFPEGTQRFLIPVVSAGHYRSSVISIMVRIILFSFGAIVLIWVLSGGLVMKKAYDPDLIKNP